MPTPEDLAYPHAGEDDLDKLRLLQQVKDLKAENQQLKDHAANLDLATHERPRCPSCGSNIQWEKGDLVCEADEDCGWTASGHWGAVAISPGCRGPQHTMTRENAATIAWDETESGDE